jgi:spore maturation protein CgeB
LNTGFDIAFFGSSLVPAYGSIIRALAGRGHQVTFYEPDPAGACAALASAACADVVVTASGVGEFDEWLEAGVLELRDAGNRDKLVAFWDVDAPATLDRLHANPTDPLVRLIHAYDVVFTCGGGPPVVEAYRRLGAALCVPIYEALDPRTHFPVPPVERFAGDLGFLGAWLPDRDARAAELLLEAAERLPERAFVLGGTGWEATPMPPNVRRVGQVYAHEHNAFNASVRAVLNINVMRVFEAAGAGACIVTDRFAGIEAFLEPGREVLVAEDGAALARIVDQLSPERARAVGLAARARVLAEHTYDHRAREVERVLDALAAGRTGASVEMEAER